LLIVKEISILIAIAFFILLLNKLKNVKEIHLDVTYKIAKGKFKLYSIIGKKFEIRFALEYLILNTT